MKKISKKLLINQDKTVRDGLVALQNNASQICIVVDKKEKLVGTVTDGDLRRFLLKKIDFDTPLKKIMNKNPLTLSSGSSENKIITTLKKFKLNSLPLVDKDKKVVNLIKLSDVVKIKRSPNYILIMCGGLGSRLRPYTQSTPKCLLKIRNKTILEHIIDNAEKQGFNKFIISINYLGDQIKKFIKINQKFSNLQIKFIREKKRLGTAGSLSLLNKKILKKDLLVVNGDILTSLDFNKVLEFHYLEKTDALMAVKIISRQSSFGIIKSIKGSIVKLDEKPTTHSMVNAGVYVLKKNILGLLKFNEFRDMTDFISELIKRKKKVKAYPIHENWDDIGTKKDFIRLRKK